MSDIYLSLTESPTVVTLSQPVVSGVLSSNVTVTNVVSVNVVTMPAITVQAAAPAVTTVAGSVAVSNLGLVPSSVATDGTADGTLNFVKIGGHQSGSNQTAHIVHVSAGGSMSVDATDSVVSISNFPSTQTIAGTVTANVVGTRTFVDANAVTVSGFLTVGGWDDVNSQYAPIPLTDGGFGVKIGFDDVNGAPIQVTNHPSLPLSATVTIGSSVTIGSLPAISGTVTVGASSVTFNSNVAKNPLGSWQPLYVENGSGYVGARVYSSDSDPLRATVTVGNSVTIGSLPAISGTVTAGMLLVENAANSFPNQNSPVQLKAESTSGSLRVRMDYLASADPANNSSSVVGNTNVTETGNISYVKAKVVAGTVTVGSVPNGSLTTRFGTPTTANTAFATSAVTNANRKYLLIQNVTTGSNVITVGIGFTPTTTQGIQLTAGAGITFESSYIPTGAVYVLSSVTASNFTILEA